MKLIVGIVHLIAAENGLQTALIERLVVCNQRQSGYLWLNLPPHIGEHRCRHRVLQTQPMNLRTPVTVVFGLRLDERIKRIRLPPVTINDHAHTANARAFTVGSLKVDCCKILHLPAFFVWGSQRQKRLVPRFLKNGQPAGFIFLMKRCLQYPTLTAPPLPSPDITTAAARACHERRTIRTAVSVHAFDSRQKTSLQHKDLPIRN